MEEQVLSASIELKNSQHIFYAGEPILGHLNIHVHRGNRFTLHEVGIKWKCEIKTHIPGTNCKDWSLSGRGIVNYLRNTRCSLPEGITPYSFLLFLPHHIPQSIHLKYGTISYILKARIKFKESPYLQARTSFKVIKNYVLRFDHKIPQTLPLRVPIFDGGEIVGNFILPSTQFLTKDDLEYRIHVQNHSGRGIQWISLILVQEFSYHEKISSLEEKLNRTQTIPLWRKDWAGARPFGDVHLDKTHSGIFRNLLPSNVLEKADLIKMSYYLIIKLRSYLRSTILEKKIPITIGTSFTYDTQSIEGKLTNSCV